MRDYEKYRNVSFKGSKYCLEELLDDVNDQIVERVDFKHKYIYVLEKNLHKLYREKRYAIGSVKELEKEIFSLEMQISEVTKQLNEDIEDLKIYRDELQRRIRENLLVRV